MNRVTWCWSIFGWVPMLHADGYLEAEGPSKQEETQSLCDLAVILGLPVEDAEQMTRFELNEFVQARMGIEG